MLCQTLLKYPMSLLACGKKKPVKEPCTCKKLVKCHVKGYVNFAKNYWERTQLQDERKQRENAGR